ncbi:MAG: PD40 domain-containing protein [Gemmatimonadota bacterium]|nr:MAG: PD40 domain-containing protein [Gemmatimonadota bacterium]
MGFARARLYAGVAVVAVLMGFGPWAGPAEAQYFGRNKVQYERFDFQVLKTEHFDIHYYPEAREAVEQTARMAERWYARLSRLLNHELSSRQIIVLYADHPDFEQTTILGGSIDEGTGGVTEAFKRRVVLPMAGSLAETDHVLGHELVHAFQYDITARSPSVGGGLPAVSGMPLWFVEGMSEYLSLGPVYPLTAMWMHDAARREELPNLGQLASPYYNPYRYGHAFWAYVAGRWGDPVVGELLKAASMSGTVGQAIAAVLQISPNDLIADWQQSTNDAYQALLEQTTAPEEYGRALITPDRGAGRLNIAPALSRDGTKMVFLSEKDRFSIEMFLADAETGEIERKILKTALDPHFESLQFINSAGDWHPNGRDFVFAGVSKGKPILTIIDTERGKAVREFKVAQVGEVFNPAWSHDGSQIVFSASVGGLMDLFILDVGSGAIRRVTNDAYADVQPTWSPDGRRIAFVSDRFSTDMEILRWGNYELALLDVETGAIERVATFVDGKSINPQWSADGSSLYFLSDQNGITNVYRVALADGELYQITQLAGGVSGITGASPAMSLAGDKLVFSAYEGDRYTIYVVEAEKLLADGPVLPPLADVSPAVLPPADRPVGDVMALVTNWELGLPESAEEFETTKYRAGLSLDYVAPPQVAVGSDRYGTYVGGGTALFWSDILGEHYLATLLQVNGSFKDVAALVGYENRRSRWNWGAAVSQIPILWRGFELFTVADSLFEREYRFRQTSREVTGVVSYPFSRVQRTEFSASYLNISFDYDSVTRVYDRFGRQVDEREGDLKTPPALNLGTVSAALVYDNTFFGWTGPVLGQRYRFELSPVFGSINYMGVLTDFRRYLMPLRPYTLAGRLLHFGRYGREAEDGRLQPLYLGYQQIIRGYDWGSFRAVECQDQVGGESFVGDSSCPVFDQLFGSRFVVGNFELRIPFPQGLGLGAPTALPPVTLALFYDVGAAWWGESTALEVGGNRTPWRPVSSYGIATRINLFGVLLMEIDFVHPNDRPLKGWHWQFGFSPGF